MWKMYVQVEFRLGKGDTLGHVLDKIRFFSIREKYKKNLKMVEMRPHVYPHLVLTQLELNLERLMWSC